MSNVSLDVHFSVRQGSAAGTEVYAESQAATTNQYGLFNMEVGRGTATTGTFAAIDWASDKYYLRVGVDAGSGFVNMGSTEMLSVPYSLQSRYSMKAINMNIGDLQDVNAGGMIAPGDVLKWNGTSFVPAADENTGFWSKNGANLYYDAGFVGIGISTPTKPLHVNNTSGQVGIQLDGDNASWVSIYVNATSTGSPGYGYLRGGTLRAHTYVPSDNSLRIKTGATDRITVTETGNIGIGTTAPDQKLHVAGAVKVTSELSSTAAPAKDVVYGNSMPVAFGYVSAGGSILEDYGILSGAHPATGVFEITLNNNISGDPIVMLTCYNSIPSDEVATYSFTSVNPNKITVNISDGAGAAANSAFSILIFGRVQ
jgi:hypothetical protein